MAGNKTVKNRRSVEAFVAAIQSDTQRQDCQTAIDMMQRVTGEPPAMWGSSIIGFGSYHYRYDSGREGDYCLVGLSPRAANLTFYIMPGFEPYQDLLAKLGKFKVAKSCLYIKRLTDVDKKVLATLIKRSVADMRKRYPAGA